MRMNIEAERSRAGMTRTELAAKLDVSLTTYKTYIDGGSIPSSKLELLADMFHVSCDYLLGRSEQQSA